MERKKVDLSLLKNEIFEQTKIGGNPKKEQEILDYIEEKIGVGRTDGKLKYVRDNFGILCTLNPSKSVKKTIFLDSHIDIVRKKVELINPSIEKLGNEEIILATALDNRVSSSILLTIILNFSFEHTQVFVFFSTSEEVGMRGCKIFCKNAGKYLENKSVDEVVVMDVCFAQTRKGEFDPIFRLFSGKTYNIAKSFFNGNKQNLPIIGNGFLPIQQKLKCHEDIFFKMTNLRILVECDYFKKAKKRFLSIPVVDMHSKISKCSFKDVSDLYNYLLTYMSTKISENE